MTTSIELRLFVLKHNIRMLNEADEMMQRDALLDVGLEYETQYDEKEFFVKDREYLILKKHREFMVYTYAFNFSQTFYSIKEYLRKAYDDKNSEIEAFFSKSDNAEIARKLISNDLKHNPESDLVFDWREVKRETKTCKNVIEHNMYFKTSWFYNDKEVVEYLNTLYNEFIHFFEKEIDPKV